MAVADVLLYKHKISDSRHT